MNSEYVFNEKSSLLFIIPSCALPLSQTYMLKAAKLPISIANIFPVLNEKWITIRMAKSCVNQPFGHLQTWIAQSILERTIRANNNGFMDPYFSFIDYIRFGTNGRKPIENWVHIWEWPLSKRREAIDFLFRRWIALDRKCARVCTQTQKHATKLRRNKSFDAISLASAKDSLKNRKTFAARWNVCPQWNHNENVQCILKNGDVERRMPSTLSSTSSVWFQAILLTRWRGNVGNEREKEKNREHSSPFGVLSSW